MKFIAALLGTVLVSCGGTSGSPYSLNGLGYSVITAGTLSHNSTSVSGTGSILVSDPISGGVSSGKSYRITFSLEDGGQLDLTANANTTLGSGVTLRFGRASNTLSAALIASGDSTDVSSSFASVDASQDMTFQIDVHNDESPAHILVWPSTNTSSFPEGDTLLNSEDSGKNTPGTGSGAYWGFSLTNAVLKAAALSDPKLED